MISSLWRTVAATLVIAGTVAAQNPDSSANSSLKGAYFVREVLMTGTAGGAVTAAASVIGVATFNGVNGNGSYTFTGQGTSLASGPNSTLSLSGTYSVGSNGFFQMTSLADPTDVDFGGVSAPGPSAFVASATEGGNVTMLIGIPAGSNVSNGSFTGNYIGGAIDFPNADITMVRQATFSLIPTGAGNAGNVSITGVGANLGGTTLNQTVFGVTYTLSGNGSGTINFGPAANTQLVSGIKTLYLSADGNIILGGSPTGYDMLVGIRALSSTGSDATANSEYFMTALEDTVDPTGQTTNLIDAFYGSNNGGSSGLSLLHARIQSLVFSVYDYTFDNHYTILGNGTVSAGNNDIPYNYTYGVSGANCKSPNSTCAQAFIATGDAANSHFYSLALGLSLPPYSGNGVYVNPAGVVSAATFAPLTNPIAPGEWIAINGTGLASPGTSASATGFPLPQTLGGVSVIINSLPVPLNYVSPTLIVGLVPFAISPSNSVYYATIQVTNNGVKSNQVTVYTNNTAPGVFANPVAVGAALAQDVNYNLLTAANPPRINQTINLYAGGLGAVTPAQADGAAAGYPVLVTDPYLTVDFGGVCACYSGTDTSDAAFAGLTPTLAGLYQIQLPIPPGSPSFSYVDISTTDGYTSQATMTIAGGAAAVEKTQVLQQRLARNKTRAKKDQAKTRGR